MISIARLQEYVQWKLKTGRSVSITGVQTVLTLAGDCREIGLGAYDMNGNPVKLHLDQSNCLYLYVEEYSKSADNANNFEDAERKVGKINSLINSDSYTMDGHYLEAQARNRVGNSGVEIITSLNLTGADIKEIVWSALLFDI